MARKSKYTPDRVKLVLDSIAEFGTDRDGYERGGISRDTFYAWMRIHPDFSDGVLAAREKFQNDEIKDRKTQARKKIDEYLFSPKIITLISKDTVDNGTEITERISERQVLNNCPQWVIDRTLGRPSDFEEAIMVLVELGWLPESILNDARVGADKFKKRMRKAFELMMELKDDDDLEGNGEVTEDV